MKFNKKRGLALVSKALAAIALVAAGLPAQAQNWPDRPISLVTQAPLLLVVPAAKARPGHLTYASAGNGGALALTDLIGVQVGRMFSATTASGPFVKSGKRIE